MKSKTSLFEPALFRKNLARFAPLWVIFLGIMLLSGPVGILIARHSALMEDQRTILSDYFLTRRYAVVLYNFIYAPLCAGMLFHYLHHERSAYMMHAYPINRSTQFVTNALSGFCFAAAPFVLQFFLSLISSSGLAGQSYLWKLLVLELLSFAFFYGLAVFCMLLSGNSIISMLSYFVLNFVFAAVPLLMKSLLTITSAGLIFPLKDDTCLTLMPLVRMLSQSSYDVYIDRSDWIAFGVYGMLGCVLLALSWLQYRARHLEQAGEAMVFRWARYAFLVLCTVLCTLGFGVMLTEMFGQSVGPWRETLLPQLLFFLLALFVGWFGAQMMLKRTVRVFRKRQVLIWVCLALVTAGTICAMRFDVLGMQRYVPEQEEIRSVTVIQPTDNSSGRVDLRSEFTVSDPAVIAVVRTANRKASTFFLNKGARYDYNLTVHYKLSSGRTVSRELTMDIDTAQNLSKLLNKPEYAVQYYETILPKVFEKEDTIQLEQIVKEPFEDYDAVRICRDTKALQKAMLQDAAEGKLPIAYNVNDQSEGWFLTGMTSTLWIGKNAEHTLELFDVKP